VHLTDDYVGFVERGENVPTLTVIPKLGGLGWTLANCSRSFTLPTLKRLKS
jgi:hypothetical protein